jgi:hypothetical protein
MRGHRESFTGEQAAQSWCDALEIAREDLAEIAEQVKAIRYLDGLWRPVSRASGIVLGAVAGNDFDPGMGAQPCGHSLGRALRQKIDRALLFEIHQDGAIDPALAQGKIVDAHDPGCGRVGRGAPTENPQDRIAAEGHPQVAGHARPGFTPCLAPEYTERVGQAHGALGMDRRERGEAFRKGPTRTRGRQAAKAADVQAQAHRLLNDWQIAQLAGIAAVDTCRRSVTIRAGGCGRQGTSVNKERGGSSGNVFHSKARQRKE